MKAERCTCQLRLVCGGETLGLYMSSRVGGYVCPPCLDAEVIALQAVKAKPWEAYVEVWSPSYADLDWYWEIKWNNDMGHGSMRNNNSCRSRADALAAAGTAMEILHLVEGKAKAGKVK